MTKRQLRKQLKEFSHKTEPSTTLYSGALGIYIGGHQYVDVPNRPGFVYVRLRNNTSELIQAHNEVVSPVYGLPVILVRNKTYYEIYGRDSVQYASYWDSSSSYLPKHGHQHEFDPDNNGGGDLVFVHGEQFYPMMTFPSGTDGGNTVLIAPYRYYYSSAWHYAGDTGAGNLLQYGPTGASNAKLLLVGIDATTGNPFVKLGSEFDASITGAAAMTSFVPTNITQSTEIPGAIVRLVTGTSTITWANIYDARQYMGILQAAGASTFLSLSDTPNSYSGQADKIVTVNSAANALEFRTNTGSFGGGGGTTLGLGFYGQDEGVGLGTGTTLNVVGSDISLSISGTVLTLLHSDPTGTPHSFLDLTDTPDSYSGQGSKYVAVNSSATALEFVTAPAGGGGGGSGLVVYDDSVYKVTGTAISFDSNLSVAVTGSVAYISSSGAGAGTTNEYVTTASAGDLSAEVVIPGLAGSPDIAGAEGAGNSWEFDSSSTVFTWDNAPDTVDSDTTLKSHLYMTNNDNTTRYGLVAWAPAGAFDARMKIAIGIDVAATNNNGGGLSIQNSDGSVRLLLWYTNAVTTGNGNYGIVAYTYASGTYSQRGNAMVLYSGEVYLRITRDGSNNCSFWYSDNGKAWRFIATQSHTLTVAKIGVRTGADAALNSYYYIDWLRTSV